MKPSEDPGEVFKQEIRRNFRKVYREALSYSHLFIKAMKAFNGKRYVDAQLEMKTLV